MELIAGLAAAGQRLAVLSNAPADVAEAVQALPLAGYFEHLVFSCALKSAKPEPECFRATLARLDAGPGEVIFLDDRPDNVGGGQRPGHPEFPVHRCPGRPGRPGPARHRAGLRPPRRVVTCWRAWSPRSWRPSATESPRSCRPWRSGGEPPAADGPDGGPALGRVDPGLIVRLLRQWRFVASLGIDLLGFLAQLVALRRLPLFAVQA